jgi:hypothetical protein
MGQRVWVGLYEEYFSTSRVYIDVIFSRNSNLNILKTTSLTFWAFFYVPSAPPLKHVHCVPVCDPSNYFTSLNLKY